MSSSNQNLNRVSNNDPDIEVGYDIWTNEVIKNLEIKGVKSKEQYNRMYSLLTHLNN